MQLEFEIYGLREAVAKDVGITVWEDHDVAGTDLDAVCHPQGWRHIALP